METNEDYRFSVTPIFQNDVKSLLLLLGNEQVFKCENFQLKYASQGNVVITFTFGRASNICQEENADRSSFSQRHVTFNAALLEHMKRHGWRWLNYSRSDTKENPIAEWTFEKPNCSRAELASHLNSNERCAV